MLLQLFFVATSRTARDAGDFAAMNGRCAACSQS
jgi:hypothetical protein